MTGLHIDITHEAADSPAARVMGELDMHTATKLRDTLGQLVRDCPGADIELDLANLGFTDSSGLSALIALHKQAAGGGGSLVLKNPSSAVRRMLAVTGLDNVLVVQQHEDPSNVPEGGE